MRPIPRPPAAVLFDLDGTLLDTERLIILSEIEAYAAIGITVTHSYLEQFIGKDARTCEAITRRDFPDLDAAALNAARLEASRKRYAGGIPLKPGALEVVAAVEAAGLPRAIVTSSERDSAARKLGHTPLAGRFGVVVSATDVDRRKPAPDPYVLAAQKLGVAVEATIAFEDSETGARAAYDAGCYTVQIPDIVPTEGQFAHLVADRLDQAARDLGLLA